MRGKNKGMGREGGKDKWREKQVEEERGKRWNRCEEGNREKQVDGDEGTGGTDSGTSGERNRWWV